MTSFTWPTCSPCVYKVEDGQQQGIHGSVEHI